MILVIPAKATIGFAHFLNGFADSHIFLSPMGRGNLGMLSAKIYVNPMATFVGMTNGEMNQRYLVLL
jgi:hypothetical protein